MRTIDLDDIPSVALQVGCTRYSTGLTACLTAAIVVGTAYILLDFSRVHEFPEGAILVTDQTSPECTAAIEKAQAVITQRGGILCHAAIVCRDLNIPCVVGVRDVLSSIGQGQTIAVCTATGRVYY